MKFKIFFLIAIFELIIFGGCSSESNSQAEDTEINSKDINVCVPNCAYKECGDDGCGGNCGNCGSNNYCNAGKCELINYSNFLTLSVALLNLLILWIIL